MNILLWVLQVLAALLYGASWVSSFPQTAARGETLRGDWLPRIVGWEKVSYSPIMTKILGLLGSSLGGAIGWAAGAGLGTMTAFMLSIIGTAAGLYAGRRAARELNL